jgi:GGDEF domain-containing protein
VISLKHFLSQNTEHDRTTLHVVRLLVEGIGKHTVAGDADDRERFRGKITEISAALTDAIAAEDLLVRIGSVLSEFELYNHRTAKQRHLQNAEMQNVVKMLTSALASISTTSKANVSKLSDIEKYVAFASELDDVRLIKGKLSECLLDIQQEANRQRSETEETIQELRLGLDRIRLASANVPDSAHSDLITGLPLRPEAETALADAGRSGAGHFVAVMVLERMPSLNARFGRVAVDEILSTFSQMVNKRLTPQDRLFRWGGPALVALLSGRNSLEIARSEFARIMETKLEHTMQTASRSVLIPISAKWCLYPMMVAPRLLVQKIDEFAARPPIRE